MMIAEEWARNIVETRFEKFDIEIVERAKQRIIDVVGCAIGGANAAGCSMIVDLVKEWDGKKEATILVHGVKAPAHNVAMANSIMARSFDYEPTGPLVDGKRFVAHVSGTTVPTAVAVAEREHAGGKELITALLLGDDIASRLIAASIPQLKPWDNTGTVNKFGATAIAGKLRGLDEQQLLNAFGTVINQLAGSYQCVTDGTHSFKLPHGLSARDGIISAELAKKGWTGVKDPLLSECGYFALYCQSSKPEILTKELGKKFYADSGHKTYPSCGRIQSAINSALELVREHDMKTEDIDEVIVNVSPEQVDSTAGQPFELGGSPQTSALFSIQYGVSSVLVRKDVRLEYYTEEYIREPRVMDFTKKVKLTGELSPEKMLAAEIKVRMKDGTEFYAAPIRKPLTSKEIEEKFRTNVAFSKTVTEENAEKVLGLLEKLEELDDVNKVVELLVV
ncbi:MmgE/PrpD family protein [Chloroflexota bacterium]